MRFASPFPLLVGCIVWACAGSPPRATDSPPADLLASARSFYEAYGRDLRAHARGRLSGYYHWDGALIVVAGRESRRSRAELDSMYRTEWVGPAYFDWERLAYDSLAPGLVLVTGGFRWLAAGGTDTTRYVYLSILQAVDSGLAIRVEHETPATDQER